jgi:hypothetical protein
MTSPHVDESRSGRPRAPSILARSRPAATWPKPVGAGWPGEPEVQGRLSDHLPQREDYVGLDLTGTTLYFGSSSVKAEIAADLTPQQRRDLTIRKEILWESLDATDAEVRAVEVRLIRELGANDPEIGYNRRPRR